MRPSRGSTRCDAGSASRIRGSCRNSSRCSTVCRSILSCRRSRRMRPSSARPAAGSLRVPRGRGTAAATGRAAGPLSASALLMRGNAAARQSGRDEAGCRARTSRIALPARSPSSRRRSLCTGSASTRATSPLHRGRPSPLPTCRACAPVRTSSRRATRGANRECERARSGTRQPHCRRGSRVVDSGESGGARPEQAPASAERRLARVRVEPRAAAHHQRVHGSAAHGRGDVNL